MSSSDIAVSVRGLSKSYTIAHQGEKHSTLAETLLARAKKPFQRTEKETFWALKDVNFDIKKGEVVGIIGRNGAGKSTLLKILSRITEPTTGQIDLYGRVGSLLEVGTGFHPELTGRENIYLNGAILGMSKAEIRKQFDAIVDFAGVEKFLDTPVKRYSSGMYVRLAFAVAAFLQSDILVVDEVLAVGDADFQARCIDRIEKTGKDGRTVLIVSHLMSTIQRLCDKCIVLNEGRSIFVGNAVDATRIYFSSGISTDGARTWSESNAPGDNDARLRKVCALNLTGQVMERFSLDEDFLIEVQYDQLSDSVSKPLTVSIQVSNDRGVLVFTSNDFANREWYRSTRRRGRVVSRCKIPGYLLAEGTYYVLAAVCSYNPNVVHSIESAAIRFQIVEGDKGYETRADFNGEWPGVTRPKLQWTVLQHD